MERLRTWGDGPPKNEGRFSAGNTKAAGRWIDGQSNPVQRQAQNFCSVLRGFYSCFVTVESQAHFSVIRIAHSENLPFCNRGRSCAEV